MYQAPWEKRDRRARLGKLKDILTNDISIEEKDRLLSQTLLTVTSTRKLREYVKVLLSSEEITKADFEGSKLIKLRGT